MDVALLPRQGLGTGSGDAAQRAVRMTWPTEMRFGLSRSGLSSCSRSQPPSTPLAAAIFARVSPGLTSTVRPPPVAVAVTFLGVAGVACGATLIFGGVAVQPELARAGGPGAPALLGQHPLGDDDLLLARRVVGHARAAEGPPGAGGELEAAAEAVAGVDRPVAGALALRELVPDGAAASRPGQRGRRPAGRRSPRRRSLCARVSGRCSSVLGDDRGSAPWQTSGTAPADLARGGGDGRRCGAPGPFLSRTHVGVGEPEPPDRTGSAAVPGSSGGETFGSPRTLRRSRH